MAEQSVYVKNAIAKNQARLFEYVTKKGYDTEDFAEKFMRSKFCEKDWDSSYSPYQLWDVCFTLEFFLRETDIKRSDKWNIKRQLPKFCNCLFYFNQVISI